MDWTAHRTAVLSSRILPDVLRTLEKYEVQEADESYTLTIGKKEGGSPSENKSQYRIAEDLRKKYPSIVRALSRLEEFGLISKAQKTEAGKRSPTFFVWTHKGVILFPDIAPVDSLSGTYNRIFGDWNDCVRYLSDFLGTQEDEANAIMTFLCWMSRRFLRWVRDEIILPKDEKAESLPELENHEYWRKLAMRYLLEEYIVHISEDPDKYFSEALSHLAEDELKISRTLSNGIAKVLKFGQSMLAGKELNGLRYIA